MKLPVRSGVVAAAAAAAVVVAGCGSSGPPKGTEGPSGGASTSGGGTTATYAEEPGATPNYIFPMLTGAYYSTTNIEQFQRLEFRSLYWIGNPKGQPIVDPARSLAKTPAYSNGNKTVTITMGNYKWSDGKPVTTRDVAFWLNLLEANKKQFAAYIPGEFP
jgi:peptide/nickel transport system substrate-binding protein